MRDASVPTPAIVDSRLIEAPFEVAIKSSQTRRIDEAASLSSTRHDEYDVSAGTSVSPAQLREQRRVAKEAEKEAARQAKIEAKRVQAEEKRAAREAKRAAEKVELTQDEPVLVEPEPVEPEPVTSEPDGPASAKEETKPSAPRASSSFDELMGYPQP